MASAKQAHAAEHAKQGKGGKDEQPSLDTLLSVWSQQRLLLVQVRGPCSALSPHTHLEMRVLGAFADVAAAAVYWKSTPMHKHGRWPVRLWEIGKPTCIGAPDVSAYYAKSGFERLDDPEALRRATKAQWMWRKHLEIEAAKPSELTKRAHDTSGMFNAESRVRKLDPPQRREKLFLDVLQDQMELFIATGKFLDIGWGRTLEELEALRDEFAKEQTPTPEELSDGVSINFKGTTTVEAAIAASAAKASAAITNTETEAASREAVLADFKGDCVGRLDGLSDAARAVLDEQSDQTETCEQSDQTETCEQSDQTDKIEAAADALAHALSKAAEYEGPDESAVLSPEQAAAAAAAAEKALAESAMRDLPVALMTPSRAWFTMVVLSDLEVQAEQAARLDAWCDARDAAVMEGEQVELRRLRCENHPDLYCPAKGTAKATAKALSVIAQDGDAAAGDASETFGDDTLSDAGLGDAALVKDARADACMDPYYFPPSEMAAWYAANPLPPHFDATGRWLGDKQPMRKNLIEMEGWLHDKVAAEAKALWRWVGAQHIPLRSETCAAWLRDHPLPDLSVDEPEPLVVPLPCFPSREEAVRACELLGQSRDLWDVSTRVAPMYQWGAVMSKPATRTVNSGSEVFAELRSDLRGVRGGSGASAVHA